MSARARGPRRRWRGSGGSRRGDLRWEWAPRSGCGAGSRARRRGQLRAVRGGAARPARQGAEPGPTTFLYVAKVWCCEEGCAATAAGHFVRSQAELCEVKVPPIGEATETFTFRLLSPPPDKMVGLVRNYVEAMKACDWLLCDPIHCVACRAPLPAPPQAAAPSRHRLLARARHRRRRHAHRRRRRRARGASSGR